MPSGVYPRPPTPHWSTRYWPHLIDSDDHRLWTGACDARGYGRLGLGRVKRPDGTSWSKATTVHRLAWELAAGGPAPAGFEVCHTCDVANCVQTDGIGVYTVNGVDYERRGHLFLAPHKANMQDRDAKGRTINPRPRRGTEHTRAVLNDDIVRTIRRLRQEGRKIREIMVLLSLGQSVVAHVLAGHTWTHVV